jgi:hypothetical protein
MQLLRRLGLVDVRELLLELRKEVLPSRHEVWHIAWSMLAPHITNDCYRECTSFPPCAADPVRNRIARDLVVYRRLILDQC